MGLLEALAGFSIVGALISKGKAASERSWERRYTKCRFDNGVSEASFDRIINEVAPCLPRYSSHERDGAVVRICFNSNSKLSTWSARIGFAEYGELTSDYWVDSNNDDSILPSVFGDRVAERLTPLLTEADNSCGKVSDYSDMASSKPTSSDGRSLKDLMLLLALVIVITVGLLSYPAFNRLIHEGQSQVPYTNDSVLGKKYETVEKDFSNSGFTSVNSIGKADLPWYLPIQFDDGKVCGLQIGDMDVFSGGDWVDSTLPVTIYYHSREKGPF